MCKNVSESKSATIWWASREYDEKGTSAPSTTYVETSAASCAPFLVELTANTRLN